MTIDFASAVACLISCVSRLTWDCKLRQGAEPGAVMRKELALSGVQRPLYRGELGPDAVEVFRFGDFAGWLIEA